MVLRGTGFNGRGRFVSPDPSASRRASLRALEAQRASQNIARYGVEGITSATQVFTKEIVDTMAVQVNSSAQAEMALFAESLRNQNRRDRDGRVRQIHDKAGKLAQAATLRRFKASHPSRARKVRSNTRMAQGALARAIASPGFYTARYDGVSFANRALLDSTAKQWYRLSFGAGRRGRATPDVRDHKIRFFGEIAGTLSLKGYGPSAGFNMPAGLWVDDIGRPAGKRIWTSDSGIQITFAGGHDPSRRGVSGDEFLAGGYRYFKDTDQDFFSGPNVGSIRTAARRKSKFLLDRASPRIPTKGIVGTNYLDAGVNVLAREIGTGWTVLMREWFQEAANDAEAGDVGTSPVALAAARENISGAEVIAMNARLVELTGLMEAELARFESVLR